MNTVNAQGKPVAPGGEVLTVTRVRRPTNELLEALALKDREAFGPTALRTYDLAMMAEAGAVFLAHVGEDLIGCCQLMRVLDEPGFFYVVGFYVIPNWQRRGLGRLFLSAVGNECAFLGAEGLVLTVSPTNTRAFRLYRETGFVDEGLVHDFYGTAEDRHILRWRFAGGTCGAVYDKNSTNEMRAP